MLCKLIEMITEVERKKDTKNTRLIKDYFISQKLPKNKKLASLIRKALPAIFEKNGAGKKWLMAQLPSVYVSAEKQEAVIAISKNKKRAADIEQNKGFKVIYLSELSNNIADPDPTRLYPEELKE